MIKLLDFIKRKEIKFTLTKFPDKTTQAWQVEYFPKLIEVIWKYEGDHELMTILQLGQLLKLNCLNVFLYCPFLPYGRQDKEINNNSTFGLKTFVKVIESVGYDNITTFDAHSESRLLLNLSPVQFHNTIYKHDVICFPDLGAKNRYEGNFIDNNDILYCSKVRNQLTGEIEGLKIEQTIDLTGKSVLVIDDICDGGRTFVEVAKELKKLNPEKIDLAVSHGIFSKGKDLLYEAGYSTIYTTNSIITNPEGFKVVNI